MNYKFLDWIFFCVYRLGTLRHSACVFVCYLRAKCVCNITSYFVYGLCNFTVSIAFSFVSNDTAIKK